jgi:hypothetical protein
MDKKYLVFTGSHYYPLGGVYDLIGTADSIYKAKRMIKNNLDMEISRGGSIMDEDDCWWHIVDIETLEIVDNDPLSKEDDACTRSFGDEIPYLCKLKENNKKYNDK